MLRFFLCLSNALFNRFSKPSTLSLPALSLCMIYLLGCGGGGGGGSAPPSGTSTSGVTTTPAAITTQPANQSIPMGLTATFSVSATGSSLSYQWSKGGSPISGATASSYTTPATAFADTGSMFTVAVSNTAGSVTSNSATLTVTARAPAAGDLRFQQVDAASTLNGYNVATTGTASALLNSYGGYFAGYFGTPLYLTPSICGAAATSGSACTLQFQQFLLPSSLASQGLSVGYGADTGSNLVVDLQSTTFPAGGNPLSAPNSVITSLDLDTTSNIFGVSWVQTSQAQVFIPSLQDVAPADLQTAATQEGAQGRVITAIAYNGSSQVIYASYGWQSDTSTIYEAQVVQATLETLTQVATTLASQGYILTAIGGSPANDALLVVGTRVQGDSLARPFVTAASGTQTATVWQAGYATVGVIRDSAGNITYLGER
jgi:hypothetical protein